MDIIGIDTGGTFTDFVYFDGERLRVHKVLSTPVAPEQAILQGMRELGLDPAKPRVVHGSTVATNAVLEGKGVRTVYIANRGLGDVLTIGRQARRELYKLQPAVEPPPVPRELCLETGGRIGANGEVVEPLTDEDIRELVKAVDRLEPQAVAINLLFSHLDEGFERAIEAALPEGLFISRSSRVLPVAGEYERGIATWLNAWVGPLVRGYLERLEAELEGARISVMQSSGEAIAAHLAATQAVRLLLSGPAGGLVGARFSAARSGRDKLLTFDMGGTSTDVALIEGEPRLTSRGHIGHYPVAVPMVDMHTIGAGGGSIARVDAGGMLQVGPESAGADPGPVCYGRGGAEPTVTDANLVLGRLRENAFLGGRMRLDRQAAVAALGWLGESMGCSAEQAAEGIIRVANEHMARALRVISVQRGIDPRSHTLVSFGGAGGLHVCALAETMGMRHAMVPANAGVLSALGMLVSPPGRQLSRSLVGLLAEWDDGGVAARLDQLAEEGRASLQAEGVPSEIIAANYSLDLRYRGQSYTLNLPWGGMAATEAAFIEAHRHRYGHSLDLPVELVNVRVGLKGPAMALEPGIVVSAAATGTGLARLYGIDGEVPVLARAALPVDEILRGPALITEEVSTTWLAPGWICVGDASGNLLLEQAPA